LVQPTSYTLENSHVEPENHLFKKDNSKPPLLRSNGNNLTFNSHGDVFFYSLGDAVFCPFSDSQTILELKKQARMFLMGWMEMVI